MTLKKGLTIDVGHQGEGLDPGAVNKAEGLIEANIVLAISLYQFERFKALGVPVALTRNAAKKMSNGERTKLIQSIGYQDCISNHINAGGGTGAEVIHSIYGSSKLGDLVRMCLAEVGQTYRRTFTKTLPNNPKLDYYFMHRDTGAVEVNIVEYAFIDSKGHDIILLKTKWKELAEAVIKAYCLYRGYKYVAPHISSPKPTIQYTKEFSDVPTNHAHKDAILEANELGFMVGSGGKFNPDEPVTRAQLATVITRLYNKLKG